MLIKTFKRLLKDFKMVLYIETIFDAVQEELRLEKIRELEEQRQEFYRKQQLEQYQKNLLFTIKDTFTRLGNYLSCLQSNKGASISVKFEHEQICNCLKTIYYDFEKYDMNFSEIDLQDNCKRFLFFLLKEKEFFDLTRYHIFYIQKPKLNTFIEFI